MERLLFQSKQTDKSSEAELSQIYSFSQIKQFLLDLCNENEEISQVITPVLEKDIIFKTSLDVMQNDSAHFLRKIKVDAATGEAFYCVPVLQLVKTLKEKCIESLIQQEYTKFHKRVY